MDLRCSGELCGFLGVDFVDHYNTFSDSMLQMLKNAAKLYNIVCERSGNLKLIEEKNEELRSREALLNKVINSLSANIFAKNADDKFRYVIANQHFADFVGKKPEEIIGKTDRDLFDRIEDQDWFESNDKNVILSGKSQSFPETVFNAQGQKIKLQTVKTPCSAPNGKKLLLGVSVDTSQQAHIAKSREIIRQCLETMVLDPNLDEGINRSISQVREYIGADKIYFFKFNFEKRTGSFHKEFNAPDYRLKFNKNMDIPFSTSLNWEEYFQDKCFMNFPSMQDEASIKKFGSYYGKIIKQKYVQSLYCHRILIQGKLWGYVGIVFAKRKRILTPGELEFVQSTARLVEIMLQHEQMQSELLQALKKAKASEKAKSYFLASMSHEIRTPLNSVIGFSEILKDGTLPLETQKNYLNDISVAGNALLSLINDVLDLSKLEAGQMVFTPTETDFSALTAEVATIFQQRLREKRLQNNIIVANMPTLLIDKLRIRQILFNLLGNAVKFTDHGHIDFTAEFTPVDNTSGTLVFSLADTGCGISQEDQKRLFKPFVQSNAIRGTQAAQNGTGLGLAIIQRMLERLHGEIKLTSKLNKGSTFTVTLHNVGYVVKRHMKALPAVAPAEEKCEFTGKVLVIDDVMLILKVTQAMLKKINVCSETANSPEAALKCLENAKFSLILCDLWMPGMNGDKLAAKIRNMYPESNIRIIALTADTEADGTFDMSVFDSVLRKPITITVIKEAIQAAGNTQNQQI